MMRLFEGLHSQSNHYTRFRENDTMGITGFTPEEDEMLGYMEAERVVNLRDYPKWRWVPTPPSPEMVAASLANQGNVAEMLKAAWEEAPTPWLED